MSTGEEVQQGGSNKAESTMQWRICDGNHPEPFRFSGLNGLQLLKMSMGTINEEESGSVFVSSTVKVATDPTFDYIVPKSNRLCAPP